MLKQLYGEICTVLYSPLYSRKLHIRVRLDSTSWDTSLMILALSLGESVVNHLARRCSERYLALLWIARWETS